MKISRNYKEMFEKTFSPEDFKLANEVVKYMNVYHRKNNGSGIGNWPTYGNVENEIKKRHEVTRNDLSRIISMLKGCGAVRDQKHFLALNKSVFGTIN